MSTVEVARLPRDVEIEIEAIALICDGDRSFFEIQL